MSWTASTGGPTPAGYYVTRHRGPVTTPGCASSATVLLTGASCVDANVPDGAYTYVVTAVFRSWSAPSATSSTVTVVNPSQLGFLVQSATVTAGQAISPPVVRLLSAAGNPVAYSGLPVTLAIGANPSTGSLAGTATVVTAANGTATFPNLSIDRAGVGYTWVAASPDLNSATSAPLTVLPPPPLDDASSYSVLGGAGVVNTLPTTISGDLGVAQGYVATEFGPTAGTVAGDIHIGDADAQSALADFGDAYISMHALTPAIPLPADLGGQTRGPGVYNRGPALAVTGILTLDAGGNPNAVFVFQVNAALNMDATGQIVLTNGAQAANVYWVVNGAVTIGANAYFKGTILADGAITLGDSTELIGRAFATGAVTMANNTIRFTAAPPPTLTISGGAALVTTDTTPAISGSTNAPAGTAVKVTVDGQVLTTTVQAGGGWTVTAASLLASPYPVVAQVCDPAGNATETSQNLSIEVNPNPVALGSAARFSVLSEENVINGGPTHLSGDLGLDGLASGLLGATPPTVDGATYINDSVTAAAQVDLNLAINDAAGRRKHTQFALTLGGRTFHVGVHESAAAVGLTGTVTLDGRGDPNAVFIFQINGALTGAASCQVNLINGAQASNVFWVIDGAAGTGASCVFKGNILARGAITLGAGTDLAGRALSRAAVTMDTALVIGATPRAAARIGSTTSSESSDPMSPSAPSPAGEDSSSDEGTPSAQPEPTAEASASTVRSPTAEPSPSTEPDPTTEPSPSSASTAPSRPPTPSASLNLAPVLTPAASPSAVSPGDAP